MSLKADKITLCAYAKVNLFLDITGTLPNGYHSLNTVMQQISWCDKVTVSFEKADENRIEIHCDNPGVPCDERNIAFKAADLFMKKADTKGKACVWIEKHIPLMAGLGGSSTDGAAVLKGLNTVLNKPFPEEELEKMGAVLGADVPFCIRGGTAFCQGIGEKMTDVRTIEHCSFVVVKPDFSCNTAQAYRLYDKNPVKPKGEPREMLDALEKSDIKVVGSGLYNVFEELYKDSRIDRIKSELISRGAVGAALSGSGSAVFGIFDNKGLAVKAAEELSYPFVVLCEGVGR